METCAAERIVSESRMDSVPIKRSSQTLNMRMVTERAAPIRALMRPASLASNALCMARYHA